MVKRIMVLVLCIIMSFSLILAGCGNNDQDASQTPDSGDQQSSDKTNDNEDEASSTTDGNLNISGFPIVKEKVTLRFFAPHNTAVENYDTNYFVTEYEKKTNVHIQWELVPPSGLQEKKSLAFASGDLPDAFFGAGITQLEAVMYGSQGVLKPLNDLIEKYNPEVKRLFADHPEAKKLLTAPDGNIYQYPSWSECFHCSYPYKMWINQKWLDNLGLKMPTTTDEFYQVLKAFKDKDANGNGDPNDEIPFSASTGWSTYPINWLMNAFVLDTPDDHRFIQDGKVKLAIDQPEYKEGLKYVAGLYKEGLIDPESFTQDLDALRQKMQNVDISLVGAAPSMHYLMLVGVDGERPKEYEAVPPLKGPKGAQWANYNPFPLDGSKYVITTASKYPEVAARWIDWFYTEEGLLAQKYGRENQEWYHPDPSEGKKGIAEGLGPVGSVPAKYNWMPGKAWTETLQNITLNQQGPIYETREFRGAWAYDPNVPLEARLIEATFKYQGHEPKEVWPPVMMTQQENDEIRPIQTQINDYVKEMSARFVTGELDIDKEWDNYINTLNGMGIQRYIEILQQAYDRYLKS